MKQTYHDVMRLYLVSNTILLIIESLQLVAKFDHVKTVCYCGTNLCNSARSLHGIGLFEKFTCLPNEIWEICEHFLIFSFFSFPHFLPIYNNNNNNNNQHLFTAP